MNQRLSHLNSRGEAHMVDVGDKAITRREAVASGRVRMAAHTLALLSDGKLPKGDVLATARIAAIQAAKKTAELIPLCHTLPLSSVKVEFYIDPALPGVRIEARCRIEGRTGVEMEALTAVSVAGLTLYDMCKAVDKGMVIEAIQLESKQGGKSGDWVRTNENSSVDIHSDAQYQDMTDSTDERIVPAEERVSVNILFFASLREQLGIERISIAMSELEQPTIAALKQALAIKDERFVKLQQERILCAVNQRMCRDDTVLAATDEVGFFPPVTGG